MDLASTQHNHLQNHWVREFGRQEGEKEDEEIVAEIMGRRFFPDIIAYKAWEGFHFAGHEIRITEATDCYGAVVWPSALVLCYFLETNSKQCNLVDKNVIEIGAGTGLVSIVASLLGAFVTATDLPELLGNLQHNVLQNTKQKCKHQPCVKELSWGIDLEKNFPRDSSIHSHAHGQEVGNVLLLEQRPCFRSVQHISSCPLQRLFVLGLEASSSKNRQISEPEGTTMGKGQWPSREELCTAGCWWLEAENETSLSWCG
ncbi:PREDICTED: protein-lysine methyltransferase METTL21E-like isoform X1 [Ficedula albicollis]|uniref:protein-lysine methyltransferase METTL21E-like isoform X1 n=1 Tax=Ficedula albicollis TaxID=59894 RepID=UPI0003594749|nr:PREDICTED: protein-lysine methyltransferase METTL21E-like isoform X1 [Ficedula albicollis]XP_005037729.1 PREDICTED: protein-lysine methyltransferase METTL21E-like isoform X1 [Ficedula albicollis]